MFLASGEGRDLPGECGHDKIRVLSGAGVVGGARGHGVHAVILCIGQRHQVGRRLGNGVDAVGAQRCAFAHRRVRRRGAIDIGGRGEQETGTGGFLAQRLQDMGGP